MILNMFLVPRKQIDIEEIR